MAIIDYGGIYRDTNIVDNENVYASNGQGCSTVWFKSAEQARKIIGLYGGIPDGHGAKMCHLCKCHYSINDPKYKKAPYEQACREWKDKIAAGDIDTIKNAKRKGM